MAMRENYDNPAMSTGLTIGDIFADYQAQVMANRKQVFLNATKAADFKRSVYSQMQEFANANSEAARKAYEEASVYAKREIERAYNSGVSRVDENIEAYVKQGYTSKLSGKKGNNTLLMSIVSNLAGIAGALAVSRQSANQQLLQITSLVDTTAPDILREIDNKQSIFLQKGLAGTYNKNGIAIEISAVGELQMRQDSQKTLLQAQGDRSAEYDLYLIQISAHPSSCPLCLPWQSKVLVDDVYKDGKADGTHELLSTAIRAGLFHWNCRHSYIIYVPGYSREDIYDFDKASKKLTAERYAIEQEQRRNERAIREWKRREQGAMSPSEVANAKRHIAEWQARQRALQQYAEERRIPFYRQYQREAIGGKTKPTINKYNPQVGSPLHYTPNVLTRMTDNGTMPVTGIDKLDDAPILPTEERTIDKCLSTTNPNFSTGKIEYTQNCQRCVMAYEARRRGYDVIASEAIIGDRDDLQYADNNGWPNVFENGTLERIKGTTAMHVKQGIDSRMHGYGNGARAIVAVVWKNGGGHVFIAEEMGDATRYVDPQANDNDCSWFFYQDKIAPNCTAMMRIDDKNFTDLILKCIK